MRSAGTAGWAAAGAALCAVLWLAEAGPASAQMVSGEAVRVNPVATTSQVLLYPGGQYLRQVQPLLQPGESVRDLGTIRLHTPTRQARRARPSPAVAAAEPAPKMAAAVPAPPKAVAKPVAKQAAQPVVKPAARRVAAAAPASPPSGYDPGFGALGAPQGAAGLDLAPPQRTAKLEPPAPSTVTGSEVPGLTKRSVILFAPQATDPAQSALGAIKFLAGDLNAAMNTPAARIQIQAFGGAKGDKGSEARRLSLKRALAIRQVLIDDGVSAERIDVRAMGGTDDSGPSDRVDVYVKT